MNRCWAYETSIVLGKEVSVRSEESAWSIEWAAFYRLSGVFWSWLFLADYTQVGYEREIDHSNMENQNDAAYLDKHLSTLLEQLNSLEAVPGLAIESGVQHKVSAVEASEP